MDNEPVNKVASPAAGVRDSFVICRNTQGLEIRASLLRLTRYLVVFEVYNPYSILQLSEVLTEFKILIGERMVYNGRAVISSLVNTGLMLVCEASLDESWLDVDLFAPLHTRGKLQRDFEDFLKEWRKIYTVLSEFKVVVADVQTLLIDLRHWMEQVELGIRSAPTGDRLQLEREVIQELGPPVIPTIGDLFGRFEQIAATVPVDLQPAHRNYIKRQIHPLVLCAPFAYRTYQKPLGYAGDYEMVNMILGDPFEGSTLFAKTVNLWFLSQAPATAHRNRIKYLTDKLVEETRRVARQGRMAKIFNLGCGPAKEVQNFLLQHDLCERASFTLLDFNDETLQYTHRLLEDIRMRNHRYTPIHLVKKSVHQILKEAMRPAGDGPKYDLLYCAGLFDYLSDRICKRLINIFYDMLAPGGLLLATNVDVANPNRQTMEYVLEWHLVYRNREQLDSLKPDAAPAGAVEIKHDATGVNIFIEVRKPESATL
jgi:extracellular factor (EF) 3-hydroxypalmitic acid methyl ester biosynthesis protein